MLQVLVRSWLMKILENPRKSKSTFHHLYVVYDLENKVDLERLKQYLYAGQLEKGKLLKRFYELDLNNTKL